MHDPTRVHSCHLGRVQGLAVPAVLCVGLPAELAPNKYRMWTRATRISPRGAGLTLRRLGGFICSMMSPQKFMLALMQKIRMSEDRSYTPNSVAMACVRRAMRDVAN